MSHTTIERLARSIAGAMPPLNATEQAVAVALYRMLSGGRPVAPDGLARHLSLDAQRIRDILSRWPGVYRDDEGRIVGFWGLALPEMAHRMIVRDRILHNWCAFDGLFIPGLLDETARIESTCPVTGEKIEMTVGPDGVSDLSPSGAVVSFITPDKPFDERVVLTFCHFVLFFRSEEAGSRWIGDRGDLLLLSVADAVEIARRTNAAKFGVALSRSPGRTASRAAAALHRP